jgi:hypothetical protein
MWSRRDGVLVNHITKSIATLEASAAPLERRGTHWPGRSKDQGPVRPMAVVVINEHSKDMLELVWVEDQEPVKTLRANGQNEPLRHPVCLRCTKRRANDLNPIASEHPIKTVGEFLVPVAKVFSQVAGPAPGSPADRRTTKTTRVSPTLRHQAPLPAQAPDGERIAALMPSMSSSRCTEQVAYPSSRTPLTCCGDEQASL